MKADSKMSVGVKAGTDVSGVKDGTAGCLTERSDTSRCLMKRDLTHQDAWWRDLTHQDAWGRDLTQQDAQWNDSKLSSGVKADTAGNLME